MASATSASAFSKIARSVCGSSFASSARPSGLPTYRPTKARSGSNSSRSALKFCKGSLDHAQRTLGKTIFAKVLFRYPFHTAHVTRGGRFAAQSAAQIIDQHIVVFGLAFAIRNHALEDFKQEVRFDIQPRLLRHLATYALHELLTRLDNSAGNRP